MATVAFQGVQYFFLGEKKIPEHTEPENTKTQEAPPSATRLVSSQWVKVQFRAKYPDKVEFHKSI